MKAFPEYCDYDAVGLAELVTRGEVSPSELVEAAIECAQRVDSKLGAIITRFYDEAHAAAATDLAGPLRGVPMALKDLGAWSWCRGVRCTGGSRYEADFVPDHDSELVRRYKAAGLIPFATTASSELGLLPVTETAAHGKTHTPWRQGYTCGGSSGGSGALVAAGVVPVAQASDGGGSIRIPAACCGVFGLKPTRARTPAGPDESEHWHGYSVAHVITRSVRDSAAVLDATAGPEPGEPYTAPAPPSSFVDELARETGRLRVGFTTRPFLPARVDPVCEAATADAAALCQELGHDVEEIQLDLDAGEFGQHYSTVLCSEVAAYVDGAPRRVGRPPGRRDLESHTWLMAMRGRQQNAGQCVDAVKQLQAMTRSVTRQLARVDVLLTPTVGTPPPEHGALVPHGFEAVTQDIVARAGLTSVLRLPGVVERASRRLTQFVCFTPLANVTGQPSISVPLTWGDDGLPIGTMFTGRFGDEATLLRLAAQLERARPWAQRRPPVWAG